MPRQTKVQKDAQKSTPTRRRTVRPQDIEWTEDAARDLLRQGYTPEAVAKRSGYSLRWVKQQRIPQTPLTEQLAQGKGIVD
jgi:hypothetical protein